MLIRFPASVQSIKKNAFKDCQNLKTIVFADNSKVREIGEQAFSSCNNL